MGIERDMYYEQQVRDDLLWKAVRQEVEMIIDSMDFGVTEVSASIMDSIADKVIHTESIWQVFNEGIIQVIDEEVDYEY